MIETNLGSAYRTCKAAARHLMRARKGRIINITSVVGETGNAGQANYAASKAGLVGLTKSVAKELASRGVRCNAIAPGYIETDMTAALPESAATQLESRIPLGRLGTPDDIAGVARFLAGPWARYITGHVLNVSGGLYI